MPANFTTHHHDARGPYALLTVGPITQRFRYCSPGTFVMGSPEDEPGRWPWEGPTHPVRLTEGFWLGDTPVTQSLWTATGRRNPSRFCSDDRPVEQVPWTAAQAFCADLGCDLPTEAQWEYACRAGTQSALSTGPIALRGARDAPALDPIAWYAGNSGRGFDLPTGCDTRDWEEKQYPHTSAGTRPVATRAPNAGGLYDMLGNVYEWCRDGQRRYAAAPVADPVGPEGASRVIRGGSWISRACDVRCAYRTTLGASDSSMYLGFRLLRAP